MQQLRQDKPKPLKVPRLLRQPAATGHGGNRAELAAMTGRRPEEILDFSASINPLGPPACLRMVINRQLGELVHYPDPAGRELVQALAEKHGLAPDGIVPGNGASELLFALPRALDCLRAVVLCPAYIDYETAARRAGLPLDFFPLVPANDFRPEWQPLAAELRAGDLVFLGHPNNPTGTLLDRRELLKLVTARPRTFFVVDESFIEFCEDPAAVSLLTADMPANLVVVRSMTKFYAIPGLRLGFAVAAPATAAALRSQLPPWSVNTLALGVGTAVLGDREYDGRSRAAVRALRESFAAALADFGHVRVFPSAANFLLLRIDHPDLDGRVLANRLLVEAGIAIRVCDNYRGLDKKYFRVAVRTAAENNIFCRALTAIILPATGRCRRCGSPST
ncbi:threonine-phosphate decarboxylase [bacterium BMS3Abin13]|nr:threonine-phosphate decarboxylase [bacterium BMS3Abin13]